MGVFEYVILFYLLIGESYYYMSSLTCDLRRPCTDRKISLICKILEVQDNMFIVENFMTGNLAPSEPTDLRVIPKPNGDRGEFIIKWRGPDDSSLRDITGFAIDIGNKKQEIFYHYMLDLRGNSDVLFKPEAMDIDYELHCFYNNPFSKPFAIDLFVTSLPKPFPISEDSNSKVLQKLNVTIFTPKYTFTESKDKPKLKWQDVTPKSVVDKDSDPPEQDTNINNVLAITVPLTAVLIASLGLAALLRIKLKNRRARYLETSTDSESINSHAGMKNNIAQGNTNSLGDTKGQYIPYLKIETIHRQMEPCHPYSLAQCAPPTLHPYHVDHYKQCRAQFPTKDKQSKTGMSNNKVTGGFPPKIPDRESDAGREAKGSATFCIRRDVSENNDKFRKDSVSDERCDSGYSTDLSFTLSPNAEEPSMTFPTAHFEEPDSISDCESSNSEILIQEMLKINKLQDVSC